ncbi:chromate transporter [Lentisphaerota bacterium WC36G]|nr:chromate transporter [Lentisphaerae bacterium WC36]
MNNIFLKLFYIFAKIGGFTFGGGLAMIPFFEAELIKKYALITSEKFSNIVAISQITPGPIGINAATYIGYVNAGITGATVATLGLLIPSLIIVTMVNYYFNKFKENKLIESGLSGIRPAVVGFIFSAALFFANKALFSLQIIDKVPKKFTLIIRFNWQGIVIFIVVVILMKKFKLSVIWALTLSALMGLTFGYFF